MGGNPRTFKLLAASCAGTARVTDGPWMVQPAYSLADRSSCQDTLC